MVDITIQQLADHLQAELLGDPCVRVNGCCSLLPGQAGKVAYSLPSAKHTALQFQQSNASVIIAEQWDSSYPSRPVLLVKNAELAFVLAARFFMPKPECTGIHPSAVIADSATLGAHVSVGAGSVIENQVTIGDHTVIGAGVFVGHHTTIGAHAHLHPRAVCHHRVRLGDRVVIQSGAVIGSEGFGNVKHQGAWECIPHSGGVLIEDDVHIGANTTIDRGMLDDTVIERGVRLDNLIHIAHNVKIGAHTAMAACCGIAGSTTIGAHCMLAGQVGVAGHLTIGDHVVITSKSGVTKSLSGPALYSGTVPCMEAPRWRRIWASVRSIEKLKSRVKQLENV